MKKIIILFIMIVSIVGFADNDAEISNIINNSLSNYIDNSNEKEITNIIRDTLGERLKKEEDFRQQLEENKQFKELQKYEQEQLNINDPDDIYTLAIIYAKNGFFESALRVANLDKTRNVKNIYIAATSARMIGDYNTALQDYLDVLKVNPYHLKSILGAGLTYRSKKDYATAILYLTKYNNIKYSLAVAQLIDELKVK